jgi:hypothetical protein
MWACKVINTLIRCVTTQPVRPKRTSWYCDVLFDLGLCLHFLKQILIEWACKAINVLILDVSMQSHNTLTLVVSQHNRFDENEHPNLLSWAAYSCKVMFFISSNSSLACSSRSASPHVKHWNETRRGHQFVQCEWWQTPYSLKLSLC